MTVAELIQKLQEVPADWHVISTKAGGSLEVREERGIHYGYVFTDERPNRMLVDRRREAAQGRNSG